MAGISRRVRFGGRVFLVPLFLIATAAIAAPEKTSVEGVQLTYDGITAEQATAIANTVAAARVVYADELGFDMPTTITVTVNCGPGHSTRLFNDGKDHVTLSIAAADSLAQPSKSGTFHLYGLCHELGHLAMYRTLKDRDWLTTAGAEGWAHYAGSVVVDCVYALKGEKLWADPYDYRADGTARLTKQLAAASPDEVTRGAGQWQALVAIVGRERMPKLFAAWQAAVIDPASPAKQLLPTLVAVVPEKKEVIEQWWKIAAPLLIRERPASDFKRIEIPVAKLENKPLELKLDDNAADGKRSIAGGGHARLFHAPAGGEWYLRTVSVHGGRYGPPTPPADSFDLALCDADMKPIAVWKLPYKSFDRAQAKWTRLQVPTPALVPANFNVCVVFRPTAQNGVFVSYDTSTSGDSRTATPGAAGDVLKQGDWMIRVELDRPKAADALR